MDEIKINEIEKIREGYEINWAGDWNNCERITPKRSKMRWCQTCQEFHDLGCFFRFKGQWLYCMINKGNRAKSMGKIKGSAGGSVSKR